MQLLGNFMLYTSQKVTVSFRPRRPIHKSSENRLIVFQVPGGVAETNGLILRGDQIMAVNDLDVSEAKREEAVAALKTASGAVKLKLRRYKKTN